MHDIKFIRSHPESFDHGMKQRGINISSKTILLIDGKVCKIKTQLQELQSLRNKIAKTIGEKKSSQQDITDELKEADNIKNQIPQIEQELEKSEKELNDLLINLPNIPSVDVPFGQSEQDNVLYHYSELTPKNFLFSPKEHWELGENLKQMDFSSAVKISGSRFVMLRHHLALMERALANFMLDIHTKEFGYIEISPPVLVKESTMFGIGLLPKFSEDSFSVNGGYRLIPTAEVPLTSIVADSIISEEQLPMRFTAYSNCFRSEAGSAGRDTRGMIRMHQFSKVELVSITKPQDSSDELEFILNSAETILQRLDLPYRTMLLSSQDMGFCAAKTYDIEVWLPGQNTYREISSCSNCMDFQAIRMKARYKNIVTQENQPVHTLNGSGLAIGRTIVAIIENYQNENGDIIIPKALQPYMNNIEKIVKYE